MEQDLGAGEVALVTPASLSKLILLILLIVIIINSALSFLTIKILPLCIST